MDSIDPTELLKFLEVFRPLNCNGCKKVIGFQNKENDKIYCAAGSVHEAKCYLNVWTAAKATAATSVVLEGGLAAGTPVKLLNDSTLIGQDRWSGWSSSTTGVAIDLAMKKKAQQLASDHVEEKPFMEKIVQQTVVMKPMVDVDIVDSGTSIGVVKLKPSQPVQEAQSSLPEVPVSTAVPVAKVDTINTSNNEYFREDGSVPASPTQRYIWSNCAYSRSLLKPGVVVITQYAWSPSSILVTAADDEKLLTRLQEKVLPPYVEKASTMTAPPELGEIVIALYMDTYYRGRVSRTKGELIEVKFIDFGDKIKVKYNEVYQVNAAIFEFPIFGLTISTGLPETIKELDPKIEDVLYPENGFSMKLHGKIEEAVPSKEPLQGTLFLEVENITLTDKLNLLCGVGVAPPATSASVQDAKTPALEIKPTPAPAPRRFTWKDAKVSDNVVSLNLAGIHICHEWGPPGVYHVNADKDEQDIHNFHDFLTEYAKKCKNEGRTFSGLPEVDDMVVAKYDDADYYRGRVVKVEGEECTVTFVDYGDTRKCRAADILPVDETIMEYPIYGTTVRVLKISDDKYSMLKEDYV